MSNYSIICYFSRPHPEVARLLGFPKAIQDRIKRARPSTSLTLVTSPKPYSYGKFVYHSLFGFCFELDAYPSTLTATIESLQEPLQAMIDLSKQGRTPKQLRLVLRSARHSPHLRADLETQVAKLNERLDGKFVVL